MTVPKNLTPDQFAEWKRQRNAKASTPEKRAKQKARFERWYEEKGGRKRVIETTQKRRSTVEGKAERARWERARRADEAVKTKESERQKAWATTEHGKELNRKKSRRHSQKKALDRKFDQFMAALEREEMSR